VGVEDVPVWVVLDAIEERWTRGRAANTQPIPTRSNPLQEVSTTSRSSPNPGESAAIDRGPVTVAQFDSFIEKTGYLTVAERPPDPDDYPDADPSLLVEGSAVFQPTSRPVPLNDPSRWWAYVPGANWRHPWGPGTDNTNRQDHPVTHIANEDAQCYAKWVGKELPSEAEWEYAARGGLDGATFAWGDEAHPGGLLMANF
jgi:formylglycine-generating enzyme